MLITIELDGNRQKLFLCGGSQGNLFLSDTNNRALHFSTASAAQIMRESKHFTELLEDLIADQCSSVTARIADKNNSDFVLTDHDDLM